MKDVRYHEISARYVAHEEDDNDRRNHQEQRNDGGDDLQQQSHSPRGSKAQPHINGLMDLTRTRSATAGGSECELQWRRFPKVKGGRTPVSGWLHRWVRCECEIT